MKKRFPSFLAGAASALALTALCTTALAASGKISYNFANVAVNGETKITAGADLQVGGGKHIPGSILYVDETGGKTNYLPVRTVSELLGAEVSYDSATQTVHLNVPAAQTAPTVKSAGLWKAAAEDGCLTYICEAEDGKYDGPAAYSPARLPEGWSLEEIRGPAGWIFQTGHGGSVHFQCGYPGKARFSYGSFTDLETAVKNKQQAVVQGYAADFYAEDDRTLLAWENSGGVLFYLAGRGVSREALLQAAESVSPVPAQDSPWKMNWLPEGSAQIERAEPNGAAQEIQTVQGTSLTLLAAPIPLAAPEGRWETVKVKGQEARFWAAAEPVEPKEMETSQAGGVTITSVVISGFGAADMNTLMWSDPDSGMSFRLLSGLDRETMLRVAENVGR